jgi:endoglucanase
MHAFSRAFLARLVNSASPSGHEAEAANLWAAEAREFAARVERDPHGNTIAAVNPESPFRVMLAGHCDEIGFLVTHIDEKGFLWIAPIGGWDPQIAQGQRVRILGRQGHVPGVIGKCPVHLLSPDNRRKVVEIKELFVDIGSRSRAEAEAWVRVGDAMVLDQGYAELPNGLAVGRGFDNRAGAFVVLEALRLLAAHPPPAAVFAVATVQEEIGLRGATTSGHALHPRAAIAVDVTFATDHPNLGDAHKTENEIRLGGGPVLSRGPHIHPRLFDLLLDTAGREKIPVQINAYAGDTGTDADVLQLSRSGVSTALVSLPNRYMHSPCELVSLEDLDHAARLIAATVARLKPDTDFTPF